MEGRRHEEISLGAIFCFAKVRGRRTPSPLLPVSASVHVTESTAHDFAYFAWTAGVDFSHGGWIMDQTGVFTIRSIS